VWLKMSLHFNIVALIDLKYSSMFQTDTCCSFHLLHCYVTITTTTKPIFTRLGWDVILICLLSKFFNIHELLHTWVLLDMFGRSNPVQVGSHAEFSQWLCHVHNVVNRRLVLYHFLSIVLMPTIIAIIFWHWSQTFFYLRVCRPRLVF
jgi:hypothetical protein